MITMQGNLEVVQMMQVLLMVDSSPAEQLRMGNRALTTIMGMETIKDRRIPDTRSHTRIIKI